MCVFFIHFKIQFNNILLSFFFFVHLHSATNNQRTTIRQLKGKHIAIVQCNEIQKQNKT